MKFGQWYNVINVFLQKLSRKWGKKTSFRLLFVSSKSFAWWDKSKKCRKWGRETSSRSSFVFRKKLDQSKANGQMVFQEKCFSCWIIFTDQIKYLPIIRIAIVCCPKYLNPLSANPTIWSKTLKQFVGKLPTNWSIFDHFVGLVLKGLRTKCALNMKWKAFFITFKVLSLK